MPYLPSLRKLAAAANKKRSEEHGDCVLSIMKGSTGKGSIFDNINTINFVDPVLVILPVDRQEIFSRYTDINAEEKGKQCLFFSNRCHWHLYAKKIINIANVMVNIYVWAESC